MSTIRVGVAFDPATLHDPRHAGAWSTLDVLLLPELADGGYAALAAGAAPHRPDDAYVEGLRRFSRSHALCLVAGSTALAAARGRPTNSTLVFQGGRLVHRYDKIHLFRPTGDTRLFSPGARYGTFPLRAPGVRVRAGVVICYDLRFPELVRALALQGMQVLFVPARWPAARDEAWRTLLRARAIENQVFVVGCDATGEEGGWSYVVDPQGEVLATNREQPAQELVVCAIDPGAIARAHALHRNLREAVLLRRLRFPRKIR